MCICVCAYVLTITTQDLEGINLQRRPGQDFTITSLADNAQNSIPFGGLTNGPFVTVEFSDPIFGERFNSPDSVNLRVQGRSCKADGSLRLTSQHDRTFIGSSGAHASGRGACSGECLLSPHALSISIGFYHFSFPSVSLLASSLTHPLTFLLSV